MVAVGDAAIGVLGGSFNPPHLGHLVIASEACAQLGLERVLFVVSATPPHKRVADQVPAATRLELARLAVEDDPRFAASAIEIEREIVYTADTLRALGELFPGRRLVFIMGSDSFIQFGTWRRPEAILRLAHLAVAPRPGDDRAAIAAGVAQWGAEHVTVLDSVSIGISSSLVRERVRRGLPIRYLVPDTVVAAVTRLKLYREARPAGDAAP
jgi:nicotinate-nucleotide adenylyltransferase